MKPPSWSLEDFETGLHYIANHEDEAEASTILDTGFGVTIILPRGLPLSGLTFHGVFMAAPILVFTLVLAGFIILGVLENWGINAITISLASLSMILLWGLSKALKLLLSNRELFPRCHFVTLGRKGIAMHFARFQFPIYNPRTAITWENVTKIHRGTCCILLTAFIKGITSTQTIEVQSLEEKVIIPFHLSKRESATYADAIEKAIKTRMVG